MEKGAHKSERPVKIIMQPKDRNGHGAVREDRVFLLLPLQPQKFPSCILYTGLLGENTGGEKQRRRFPQLKKKFEIRCLKT